MKMHCAVAPAADVFTACATSPRTLFYILNIPPPTTDQSAETQFTIRKVVWTARLEQSTPIERKNIQALVNAMSIAAWCPKENAYGGVSQIMEREAVWKQEQEPAQEVEES